MAGETPRTMMQEPPVRKRIVLVGGGHAHAVVLRSFGMRPEPGVGITVIAKELDAPYSGMLPGWVAGHYTFDQCHLDFVRLARFAGARLIHGEADGIDRAAKRVSIKGRPPIAYDLVSIDTGITPLLDGIDGADRHAIAVKPVSSFAPRWTGLLARSLTSGGPRRLTVVGTGAAGLELVLAARHRLRCDAIAAGISPDAFSFALAGSGALLPTHNARARRLARAALASAGITLIEHDAAVAITDRSVTLESGRILPSDATLVTTKAAPPAWFAQTDLVTDGQGYIAVRPTLQMTGDDDVFAAGDCASVLEHPREKAGVFAVRQGPPLADNLRRRARAEQALPFTPQTQFLTLLSLGGKAAIASRGAFAGGGEWAWSWKDRIDRKFMDMFHHLAAMTDASPDADDPAMRCGGCAAKVGPATLAAALDRLDTGRRGAASRDDAAVIDDGGPLSTLETVDFFRAFWPEPYVFGEIAAEHALSDIYAMGGRPIRAQAVAVLPYAGTRQREDDLYQLMAGARATFERAGVSLAGGHSSEGAELAAGFFVTGTVPRDRVLRKHGLRPGDVLIATKPLGTGIVFAGWMRGLARARDVTAALAGMRVSNATAAHVFCGGGATALTDVTGFGLLGHLVEMIDASGVSADICAAAIHRYPGVDGLIAAGIRSTLLSENLALARRITGAAAVEPMLALLFDPQTSGGLLAGVPEASAETVLAALRAAGVPAYQFGMIVETQTGAAPEIGLN